jgi:Thioesterase-like superfamily
VPAAFYEPDGETYVATASTRGPWDPQHQHAGPPAGLLGREIERCGDGAGHVGRITFEILRPVPIAGLRVGAEVVRPGRRVEMIEASLSDTAGTELMRARAWRLRGSPLELEPPAAREPIPSPAEGVEGDYFPTGERVGYHTAIEYRFISGSFTDPGPATVWMRMRERLVAGEDPTPLQRVLVVADSGNGVSSALDWRRYSFVNVDLSVHLERLPGGEWLCLDAVTLPQPEGVATSDALLLDERGRIGRAMQTLLISAR